MSNYSTVSDCDLARSTTSNIKKLGSAIRRLLCYHLERTHATDSYRLESPLSTLLVQLVAVSIDRAYKGILNNLNSTYSQRNKQFPYNGTAF